MAAAKQMLFSFMFVSLRCFDHDLDTLLAKIHLERFLNFVERELVRNERGDGQADLLGTLQEVVRVRILEAVVNPAAGQR